MNTRDDLVTATWIARQVGVGRAAVANWRKRYPDFPPPIEGMSGPLFSWLAVQQWLAATGKADQLAAFGRTGTGTQRIGDAAPPAETPDRDLTMLTPRELLARVLVSLLPRLSDRDAPDDTEPPTVLDPACRDAAVLLAVAERFSDHVRLAGQAQTEVDAQTVRQSLLGHRPEIRVGDTLVQDRFAESRGTARGVLCFPPRDARQWPALHLAADPRWRHGLPEPGDPELAWVQHCVAHLRPHGVAVVVMSPVSGVRPSGRHVRAALVRAGVLRDVIALPKKLTPSGDGSVHLWVLRPGGEGESVRMIDLTPLADIADVPTEHAGWEALFASTDFSVVRAVPHLELLDGDVPLVPSRYLRAQAANSANDLGEFTRRLARLYAKVGRALPEPVASPAQQRPPEVTLAELERSKALTILPRDATPRKGDLLFRTLGRAPVVATGTSEDDRGIAQVVGIDRDRLDPHFLAMFVRADAFAAPVANTLSALTRDDVRRCRVPRIPLAEQRTYGDAFRRLQELDDVAGRLAGATRAIVAQTIHNLTTGTLDPFTVAFRETTRLETKTEKSTT